MNNKDSFSSNGHFALSYELLCLMQWLLEHEQEKLKKIIVKSLDSGLREELKRIDETMITQTADPHISEEMQYAVVEFFGLLENLLSESLNEQAVKKAFERNMMPAIEQIDTTLCDNATVKDSIEKATKKIEMSPSENPKELLCKELIKRWRPLKDVSPN